MRAPRAGPEVPAGSEAATRWGLSGEGRENGTHGLLGSQGGSLGVCLPFAAPDFAFAAEWVWVKSGSRVCDRSSGISN